MKRPLISIVIPTWNGMELLKTCLVSLKKQTFKDFEVIIVDNASSDETVTFVNKFYPEYKIISLKKNYGFSTAVNKGIKSSQSDYIYLLNNDTEVDKKCLNYLYRGMIQKNVGFIVPKMLNFYDRSILELAGNYFTIDSVGHLFSLCVGKKDAPKYNQEGYTFLAPGGAALFKKEIFKKIGLFDESYFLYLEDADLSLRAQLAGFKGWYEPKAVVFHMGMATSSKNMRLVEPECFRNMTVTIIKNFPTGLLLHQFNWLKIILVNLNTLKYLTSKGYLKEALLAEWYVIRNIKNILKKRKKIQGLKIITDQYFIKNIKEKKFRIPYTKIYF